MRDLQKVLDEVDDERLTFGAATREDGELVHLVARLHGAPPTVSALHESVLDGLDDDLWGDTLPQKSTYFWPKPRTGMVIRPIDDAR